MKKTIVTLITLFAFSIAFAQNDRVTGPEAKNAKVWNKERVSSQFYHDLQNKDTKGPEAKNQKLWTIKDRNLQAVQRAPKTVKGPKAKNAKPWK
jgi:hypothetical protein